MPLRVTEGARLPSAAFKWEIIHCCLRPADRRKGERENKRALRKTLSSSPSSLSLSLPIPFADFSTCFLGLSPFYWPLLLLRPFFQRPSVSPPTPTYATNEASTVLPRLRSVFPLPLPPSLLPLWHRASAPSISVHFRPNHDNLIIAVVSSRKTVRFSHPTSVSSILSRTRQFSMLLHS